MISNFVELLERNKNETALITINTNDNETATKLLDFFDVLVSHQNDYISIKYEDVDQIPAICRLLLEAKIDIIKISIDDVAL